MEKHKCSARVFGDWHSHPCRKPATIEVDGKWYCGTHNPIKAKTREAKATKELEHKMLICRVEGIAQRACFQINPDNPQAVAESIKDMYEALKWIAGEGTRCLEIVQQDKPVREIYDINLVDRIARKMVAKAGEIL